MICKRSIKPTSLALAMLLGMPSMAQIAPPDAGLILQESQQQTPQPLAPSIELDLQGQPLSESDPGGMQIMLNAIRFTDNSVYSAEQLMEVLGDVIGQSFDFAGLRVITNRISLFYRETGYPFARALIPEQNMSGGVLLIQIVEGRYGEISTSGDVSVAAGARPHLLHALEPGAVIEAAQLERTTLLLGDLPGIRIVPVMRPGADTGTGNLDVQVFEEPRFSADVEFNNHGNRYSGEYRVQSELRFNRLLVLGDALSMRAIYTNENTWLGQVGYSLPVGYSGLRASLSYAHNDYTLSKPFSGYQGTAKATTVGLSYPLLRSQRSNLVLNASYQYKDLDDSATFDDSANPDFKKGTRSRSYPVGIQFDRRDGFGGGGITYGSLAVTPGRLSSSDNFATENSYSFVKANLQVLRLQRLSDQWTLFANLSGQMSNREELDGSESFSMGGPNAVRAFPVGEGSDARGWFGQVEMRFAFDANFVPYAFFDMGSTARGDTDQKRRTLAGAGVGTRYNRDQFSLDASLAWKTQGGDAQSDDRQRDPRLWFAASYRF